MGADKTSFSGEVAINGIFRIFHPFVHALSALPYPLSGTPIRGAAG
jgi:hypothetical protein